MKQLFLDILNQLMSVNTAWSSTTAYSAGQYVLYNGVTYLSNTGNNLSNIPGTGATISGTTIPYWVSTPFFVGSGGTQFTPFIAVWNNQAQQLTGGTYSFQLPAIFIEFVTNTVIVLSDGIESFDPLDIKIHIIDNMIDAGDGTQDQNLRIFDYKQQVYTLLKQFEPTNCVKLFRVSETQDYNHTNFYHYIQTYRTNLIDSTMQRPLDGIIKNPATGLTVTSSFAN